MEMHGTMPVPKIKRRQTSMKTINISIQFVSMLICTALPFIAASPVLCSTMQSSSYTITADVVSGGGGSLSSATYRLESTIGQPTPIMDQTEPPYSTSYDLYPGFWYAMESAPVCMDITAFAVSFGFMDFDFSYNPVCDFDSDGDVDGIDLFNFITGL